VVGGISRTVEARLEIRRGWAPFSQRCSIRQPVARDPRTGRLLVETQVEQDLLPRGTYYTTDPDSGTLKWPRALESISVGLSFLWVRVRPPKDLDTFEGWTLGPSGGVCTAVLQGLHREGGGDTGWKIKADWAAQRIKKPDARECCQERLVPGPPKDAHHFAHRGIPLPAPWPGHDVERTRELVEAEGSKVVLATRLVSIRRFGGRAMAAVTQPVAAETASKAVAARVTEPTRAGHLTI